MMHTAAEHHALQAAKPARKRTRHTGEKMRYEGTRMACPHCGAESVIRSGNVMSKTMREAFYACSNVECGHTFVAVTEVQRTLSPSAIPDPTVNIPLSSHVRRDMVRVVLDNAGVAQHQARFSKPETGDLFAGNTPPANTT